MATTRLDDSNVAPLAFTLSICSESVLSSFQANAVNNKNLPHYPFLLAAASAVASAATLCQLGMFTWLSWVLGGVLGYLTFKPAKRYFEGAYLGRRIEANRNVLSRALGAEDAGLLADIAAGIVKSQYGNQKWAIHYNERREQGACVAYHYLAAVLVFAPEIWKLCSRQVYDRAMAGVVSAPTSTAGK